MMVEKDMEQHYPAENNECRRGMSARRHLSLLIRMARKRGIAQNLNAGDEQVARVLIDEGKVTAILQPGFIRALNREFSSISKREKYLAGQNVIMTEELQYRRRDEADRQERREDRAADRSKAIRAYNHYLKRTSGFQRAFGNHPGLYQCLACGHCFAHASARKNPVCRSCNSRRIKTIK